MKNLDLQMNFNTNIASMDFSKLRTDNISDYENPEVLEVIYFDVSKVLNCLDNGSVWNTSLPKRLNKDTMFLCICKMKICFAERP